MLVRAGDAKPGQILRLTRPVDRGAYYLRAKPAAARRLLRRLWKRNARSLTTEELRTEAAARRAEAGETVLLERRSRFRDYAGQPHEILGWVDVDPDYRFRVVASPPAYSRPGNGGGGGD